MSPLLPLSPPLSIALTLPSPSFTLVCDFYCPPAAIDIWSVGCIFAELLGRKPLFPGKDYVHQLNLITRVLGSPSESDLEFIDSEKAKRYMRSLPHCQRVRHHSQSHVHPHTPLPPCLRESLLKIDMTDRCSTLSLSLCLKVVLGKYYPHSNPMALDLIDKMLQFNPHKRITVEEALEHPYMATLHDPSDEPCCQQPFHFPLDDGHLNGYHIRDLILEDIMHHHPEHFHQ